MTKTERHGAVVYVAHRESWISDDAESFADVGTALAAAREWSRDAHCERVTVVTDAGFRIVYVNGRTRGIPEREVEE